MEPEEDNLIITSGLGGSADIQRAIKASEEANTIDSAITELLNYKPSFEGVEEDKPDE